MSEKNKKGLGPGWIALIIIAAMVDFALLITYLLQGRNIALFNPRGLIAQEQHDLMLFTIIVMFAAAIPTFFVLYLFAWKYRESNTKRIHDPPHAHNSKFLVLGLWLIPTAIIALLTCVMIPATYKLAPHESISADAEPLTIQVISLRWKWLFLYPEQNIATVNFVQIPVNTPVTFELTADEAPMSSFWIPNLGGQLYSMTSHVNRLNLIADTIGDYPGSSAEINGEGFAGMKFTTRASSRSDFDQWVKVVKQSPNVLDTAGYKSILEPSENNPPAFYSAFDSDLYNKVVMKYRGPDSEGHGHN